MQASQQMNLPVPGRVLKVVLGILLSVWLVFALAINWGGVSEGAFFLLTGNSEAIARGEVWRLFTAMFMHMPSGSIGHILGSMIGLYFLGASLESSWGSRRFAWFLAWTGVLSYTLQFMASFVLSPRVMANLTYEYYFGATPVIYAVAIAWACSFKGQRVMLMFVLPVTSRALIWITVGVGLMVLIAGGKSPSGHIASFAGMGFGYLLGGGSPPPLRRWLLRYRLASLERQVTSASRIRKTKGQRAGLKVISGGREDRPTSNDGPRSSPGKNGMLH